METISYNRSVPVADASNKVSQNDLAKSQIFKSITRNFYLHKSFDYQSDLEFLPAIPSEPSSLYSSTPSSAIATPNSMHILSPQQQLSSPVMNHNMLGNKSQQQQQHQVLQSGNKEYFHGTNPAASQQINDLLSTPKARMLYLNQELSPKRNNAMPTNTNNSQNNLLRKRVASNNQSQFMGGMHVVDQSHLQQPYHMQSQKPPQQSQQPQNRGYWVR